MMTFRLEMRQALICSVCEQEIDPAPAGVRPQVLAASSPQEARNTYYQFLRWLDLCPSCMTCSEYGFTKKEWRRIVRKHWVRLKQSENTKDHVW